MNKSGFDREIIAGSVLKLLRHKEFTCQCKTPISAQIILTNACNLRCVFCVNKPRWGSQSMTKEQAFRALDDLNDLGVKGIEITGGGEQLIHPNFNEILEHAIELGLTPALVTNGIMLTKVPKALLNELDWIRISINASRDLYKEIHDLDAYDKVMLGIEHIIDLDISNKGVSYIFCSKSTLDDTQKLIDDLQRFKLDYFRFSIDVFDDLKFKINPENLRSKSFPIISHSERDTYVPKTCGMFYYKPVIDCSGIVYPCCTNMHREVLPLGKIEDIKEIIANKDITLDTSKCLYCIYGEANDLIEAVSKPVKNEDFV